MKSGKTPYGIVLFITDNELVGRNKLVSFENQTLQHSSQFNEKNKRNKKIKSVSRDHFVFVMG
jgi:hypothetical protein